MARPCKCRCICSMPDFTSFGPANAVSNAEGSCTTVHLGVDEYEVIRLIDYMGFSQEKCAQRMNVARTTIARMYEIAREKIAKMLVEGKTLAITGGEVTICKAIRPECIHEPHCCHKKKELNDGGLL